ncbi:GDSL-type esterase/lipase family protein [Paenibacillus odorifer]|uniref:Esterase n=1 Tax=Paenibacillus odorifer TaxID=189426 RepID=A0A1R0XV92_9BACL|nr:GDSL-type esterase/lipase family protein [Paenibacillus odorifer]OMD39030.1 esterase [Paenibacillus odorifer]
MLSFRLHPNPTEQAELSPETSLLTLYPLKTDQPRPFILVLPGGGYQHLAKHEGAPVAHWLNSLGIHAGVLDYQVGDFSVTSLLDDVEEALRWIRGASQHWNVISNKVGMIGFSAGGHLASIFSTTRAEKPDLLLLGYPVITFQAPYAHMGSRLHFLGDNPAPAELRSFSSESQVTSRTPPTFIWTTANDASVPVENSLLFSNALSEQGIPFELHIFEEGRHGLGLAKEHPHCRQWLSLAANWLREHHYTKTEELITPTLFIAGDSTAAIKGAGEKPMTGWGEYLQSYFGTSVRVENRAINGRSTKSFISDGRLDAILIDFKAGDYLFIQFGHNDEKKEDPLRYTDPDTEYRRNLTQYIEAARQLGGIPVLLTSVSRRRFTSDGQLDPLAVGAYPEAMRQVAEETQTPLLDIFAASQALYCLLGQEESKKLFMHLPENIHPNYPNGVTDDTHFSDEGAQQIAKLVVQALKQNTASPISNLQQLL